MINEVSTAFSDDVSISQAIIAAVCELQEVDSEELDFVLYDWINPDALTALVNHTSQYGHPTTVEFKLAEYLITFRTDQTVTVRRANAVSTAQDQKAGTHLKVMNRHVH